MSEKILCEILKELENVRKVLQGKEVRETEIRNITIPEEPTIASPYRTFSVGTTEIDFRTGVIINPDGSKNYLKKNTLDSWSLKWLRSLTILSNQNFVLWGDGIAKNYAPADYNHQLTYLQYSKIYISLSVEANIQLFACTNPEAVISVFKSTTVSILEQESINGDATEAQTWDTVTSLVNNLNRIRKKLNDIIGGTLWSDAVSASLSTIWAKFHATTGHKHTGAANDSPKMNIEDSINGPRFKVGYFTRDTSLATGTQAITGVGFKPSAIMFISAISSSQEASWGFAVNGSTSSVLIAQGLVTADTYDLADLAIWFYQAGGIYYYGDVTSYDADGFTITWTKTGAKTGTATIKYMAFR